jgi:hypothetical protein
VSGPNESFQANTQARPSQRRLSRAAHSSFGGEDSRGLVPLGYSRRASLAQVRNSIVSHGVTDTLRRASMCAPPFLFLFQKLLIKLEAYFVVAL